MSILKANRIENLTTTDGGININNSGNVGIGTTSPGDVLTVAGTNAFIKVDRSNGNPGIDFRYDGSTTNRGVIDVTSAGALRIAAGGNTERLRIDSSGNVLVGKTTTALTTVGTRIQSGSVDCSNSSSSTNLGTNSGGSIRLANTNSTDNNFSNIGGYNSNGLVVNQINFINTSHSSRTGEIGFSTHDGSVLTERMRINSSGNVGIGKSSNLFYRLTFAESSGDTGRIGWVSTSGNRKSSIDCANTAAIRFNVGTSDTERMRIDSSGRLLVGTTASDQDARLTVARTGNGGTTPSSISTATVATFRATGGLSHEAHVSILGGSTGASKLNFGDRDDEDVGSIRYNHSSNFLEFATNTTTCGRFTNNGRFDVFASSGTDAMFVSSGASAGTAIELFRGMHSATAIAGGTTSLRIYSNGNIQNTNNSYGSISDVKLKENIADASSQWDDIKAVQIRNYNFKEDTGHPTHTQIGVVAQEVETVSPGLVYDTPDTDDEGNDLGTVTKSVNYSVLYMKAVKALQEAIDRIETLETKVAALEAQ